MPEWNDVISIGPGPGGYCPRSTNDGPRFTIQRRYNTSVVESSPGPADYTPILRNPGPAFTMGSRTSRSSVQSTPGPSDYNGDILTLRHRSPTYRFSTQPRRAQSAVLRERSPGPADYHIPNIAVTHQSARASSISGRPRSPPQSITPGPGDYQVSMTPLWPRIRGGTIGTRPVSSLTAGFLSLSASAPGPADYTPKVPAQWCSSSGFTFGSRHGQKLETLGPGPAGYHPRLLRKNAPAFTIQRKDRSFTEVCEGIQIVSPGPAHYHVGSLALTTRRAPAFSFSRRHYIYQNTVT
ncbi:H-SHIPPO 1 [Giardia lamblia P15]|uniref:H-SHIPPO 1 n=1 Tax=Giardia intestinalis (strain P15) TaxID=658858 RepID=E1F878_GIAIA|nr:H-SHIPPO 1 [Giardia lamblia P15]